MKNSTLKKIVWPLILLVAVGLIVWAAIILPNLPDKLDSFATCIKNSGTIFYGAFWCPHCQAQKADFGRSERLLPYVECSTPDGQSQLQVCTDQGVQSYPTWVFKDGSRLTGETPLATLASKTGCALPKD